jgi:large subunit ribosomal protein L35
MPKMKTNSSAKKRFSFTGSGKLKKNFAGKQHNLNRRSQSMKRKARGTELMDPSNVKIVRPLLPYGRK